jgi:hypothetical protein
MGTLLIFLGVFLYFMISMVSFVFMTPKADRFLIRLKKSITPNIVDLRNKTGPEYGIPLFQITGIFWVIAGLLIIILGEPALGFTGKDILLAIIFLSPVWISALIAEKRRKAKR